MFAVNSVLCLVTSPLRLFKGFYFVLTFALASEYMKHCCDLGAQCYLRTVEVSDLIMLNY